MSAPASRTERVIVAVLFGVLTGLVIAATIFMAVTDNELWWIGLFSTAMGVIYTHGYAKDAIR